MLTASRTTIMLPRSFLLVETRNERGTNSALQAITLTPESRTSQDFFISAHPANAPKPFRLNSNFGDPDGNRTHAKGFADLPTPRMNRVKMIPEQGSSRGCFSLDQITLYKESRNQIRPKYFQARQRKSNSSAEFGGSSRSRTEFSCSSDKR